MKSLTLLFLAALTISLSAQMERFPLLEPISDFIPESVLIEGIENELIMFWIDSTDLHMSKSIDEGTNWDTPVTLVDNATFIDSLSDLNALKLFSGRILVTYKHKFHYLIYSDDNGASWSEPIQLVTDIGIVRPRQVIESSLSQTNNAKIWFTYSRVNQIYALKSDDGVAWDEKDTLLILDSGEPHYPTVYSNPRWDGSISLIYQLIVEDTTSLYHSLSYYGGGTWSEPELLFDDNINRKRCRVLDPAGDPILTFTKPDLTPFDNYAQNNVFYSVIENGTDEWTTPTKITDYTGFDGWQNISEINNKIYITFNSSRNGGLTIWYGIVGESEDSFAPPAIFETDIQYQNNDPTVNIYPSIKVFDIDEISNVSFIFTDKSGVERTLELLDDGMHNDAEAGDYIYGNALLGLYNSLYFDIYFSAVDVKGNISKTKSMSITSPFPPDGGSAFLFDNNNLIFPIDDQGILGDVAVLEQPHGYGVHYDESRIIYSAGFALSGYSNGNLWANGMMTSSRIEDYIHGEIDGNETSNHIYIVRSSQPDFYQSWIDWKDAVTIGAEYYDGNGDGIYDPIDKNGNGRWDEDEDKPNIIGDITAFTVYNDGKDSSVREYSDVEPQGIEIKQTTFSYNKTTLPELENVIYVKYSIENIGTVADTLDSVYFGAWADTDIGEYNDDLFGTDTILNASYSYNEEGEDDWYGINPPAVYLPFIQTPPIYVEGETFTDINGNGIYDEGTDTPLDTAVNRKGKLVGFEEFPGAKNNKIAASIHYISAHPTQGTPRNKEEMRGYMFGLNQQRELVDPCNWVFGKVFNEDCSTINPRLLYSGDPVTQNGWVNIYSGDLKQLGSTGPFDLVKGKPIEIIVAYVVGRGTDHLSSITEARINTQNAIDFYETNFNYTPVVGVKGKEITQLPEKFVLHQNYPNPFNPSTVIRYTLPSSVKGETADVKLIVYDVLGREVATLVNKEQQAGSYEVVFDVSNLGSGVYFYQLKAGSFIESRKMVLLK